MIYKTIASISFLKKIYAKRGLRFAEKKLNQIQPYLQSEKNIIDIGTGNGTMAKLLKQNNYNLTTIDIANISLHSDIIPVIYDGKTLPFENKQFFSALLLTVLHHSENPSRLIDEALRVGHELIIIEDTYSNWFQKCVTYFTDTLINGFHSPMTYNNKTKKEWIKLLEDKHIKIIHVASRRNFLFFQETFIYCTSGEK